MVKVSNKKVGVLITIQPNRSATWQEVKWLMLFCSVVCLMIAFGWAMVGVWFILPFAGLELGLLLFIMYRVSQQTHSKEMVHIDPTKILVQSGSKQPEQQWTLNRKMSEAVVFAVRHPEDAAVVHLRDGKQRVELGKFLNKEDKEALIKHLSAAGIPVREIAQSTVLHV